MGCVALAGDDGDLYGDCNMLMSVHVSPSLDPY